MVRLPDHPNMTIAVDWDVKPQTKPQLYHSMKLVWDICLLLITPSSLSSFQITVYLSKKVVFIVANSADL